MASPSLAATAAAADAATAPGGALSALISKRAKAVHKKLQRISAYESQDKASLNADQLRALASKPTLDAVHTELNAVLAHAQQHEVSTRADTDAELARLTEVANANAQRADEAHAHLSFLLQFLHLYSLFNRDSTLHPSAAAPDVPAALAATITSADIHALSPVLYAFANAPLFDASAEDSATALGIIKRVRDEDPTEIVFSAGAEPEALSPAYVSTGITHSRLAELVKSLTAVPPMPTQFGAVSFGEPDLAQESAQPVSAAEDAVFGTDPSSTGFSMPMPHPTGDGPLNGHGAPTSQNYAAESGLKFGSGPLPASGDGAILFMQASEVEGEAEPEPTAQFDPAPSTSGEGLFPMPVAEPAATIEPEGGAVDGAPAAQDAPIPLPDATFQEPVPPVLRELEEQQSAAAADQVDVGAGETSNALADGAEASQAAPRKFDWASLDDDDDEAIQEEVLRSTVLIRPIDQGDAAKEEQQPAATEFDAAQAQHVPASAEAEAARLVQQVDKAKANGSVKPSQPSSTKQNQGGSKNGAHRGSGPRGSNAQQAPVPVRKPEPVVDEDGFVVHTTKKTIRQQQMAAQQEPYHQRGGSAGRGGGRGGSFRGRGGRGGAGGSGPGPRRERREGSGASVGEGADGAGQPSQSHERFNGPGSGPRSGPGPNGAGRGQAGAQGQAGGSGARGRGRGRPASGGPRPAGATAPTPAGAPAAP